MDLPIHVIEWRNKKRRPERRRSLHPRLRGNGVDQDSGLLIARIQ